MAVWMGILGVGGWGGGWGVGGGLLIGEVCIHFFPHPIPFVTVNKKKNAVQNIPQSRGCSQRGHRSTASRQPKAEAQDLLQLDVCKACTQTLSSRRSTPVCLRCVGAPGVGVRIFLFFCLFAFYLQPSPCMCVYKE